MAEPSIAFLVENARGLAFAAFAPVAAIARRLDCSADQAGAFQFAARGQWERLWIEAGAIRRGRR